MVASSFKTFTFAALPKATTSDPVEQRRSKLCNRIQQQISLANDPSYQITRQKWVKGEGDTKELREVKKKVRPWWRLDQNGNTLLAINYGARPVEFSKGMHAIMVGKKERLVEVLEQVMAATRSGELDSVLSQMSKTAVLAKGKKAA